MKTPLDVGLIGCGRAAERLYLPNFLSMAEARLVAVADPIRERREFISSKIPDCLAFSSAKALLQKTKIAAVVIATPPSTHVAIAKVALRAGIPVLVEKPLAPSMTGIKALEALVDSSTSVVMVGFNRRYWEPVRQLKGTLCNLRHSDAISAQLTIITNIQSWSPVTRASDPLEDLGSHQLDLLRYVFDREILSISAHWVAKYTIRMRVRLVDGVYAECLAAHGNVWEESMSVQCGRRQYRIHVASDRIQPAAGPLRDFLDLSDAFKRRISGKRSSFKSSCKLQLISFLDCVRTGAAPEPSVADGIAAVRAVEVARQSAAKGGMEVFV